MITLLSRYARNNPLGNRVLAAILLCSTSLAFCATLLQLFLDYKHNMSVIETRMTDIRKSYPNTLAESMWNVDMPHIQTQIKVMANLPDVVYVNLMDTDGKIIEQSGAAKQGKFLEKYIFPIEYKKNKANLGQLIIVIDVERVYAEIRDKALIILFSQMTKTLLVALFSLFIFNYLVSRHLSTLAHYAKELDFNKLSKPLLLARPPSKRADELDLVVSAFNFMSGSIKKDYDELRKYRSGLENLVQQRTLELAQKVSEKEEVIETLNFEISERLLAEKEAIDNERRYRQLVEMLPDAISVEVDNKIVFFNSSLLALLQVSREDILLGKPILDFIPLEWHEIVFEHLEEGRFTKRSFECKVIRSDGTIIEVEISQAFVQYKGQKAIQTILHDITKHKHYEEQLRKQALHDALTGLPNRILLNDRIDHEINMAERLKHRVYVLFLDLDRFKYVNDTLGHDSGDVLLKATAQRIASCLRKSDTLARLGGDEFVIVLGRVADEAVVLKLLDRLKQEMAQPILLNGHEITVSTSIGISHYPQDGHDAATLLKHADSAMYQAKFSGSGGVQRYTPEMQERINENLAMEQRLRHAIEKSELMLYYQPIVDAVTQQIVGAEALIRWQHPTLGLILPARFIPLAEEIGLIISIGNWVMRTACSQAKIWQESYLASFRMAVNLSMKQLVRPDLENEIKKILAEFNFNPAYLELEITESASMTNPEQIVMLLRKLKTMGLKLAIDDFGTGYSNLSYLTEFPVDHLKLDRIFIRDIHQNHKNAMLIKTMIYLAHDLNLKVIAEGVEETLQFNALNTYGCDEIQGHYFYPPLTAEQFDQLLQEKKQRTYAA